MQLVVQHCGICKLQTDCSYYLPACNKKVYKKKILHRVKMPATMLHNKLHNLVARQLQVESSFNLIIQHPYLLFLWRMFFRK